MSGKLLTIIGLFLMLPGTLWVGAGIVSDVVKWVHETPTRYLLGTACAAAFVLGMIVLDVAVRR